MPSEKVPSTLPSPERNGQQNVDAQFNAPIPSPEEVKKRKAALEAKTLISNSEDAERAHALQKQIKSRPGTVDSRPTVILSDPEDQRLAEEEKMKAEWRALQNKQAKLEEQIKQAAAKITIGDRFKQAWQWIKGEPSIGPYYRLNDLKAQLDEINQQLSMYEEDQNMARLRAEARAEFKNNQPAFVKSPERVMRDVGRDAAATFMPGIESSMQRDERLQKESEGIALSPEEFTDVEEFEASLDRDPALAAQQRKDMQKANRDRLKAGTKARAEQPTEETPSYVKSPRRIAKDLGRDAASAFIPGIESSMQRDERLQKESEGIALSPEEFTNIDEFEASLERDPALAEQQRKDMQKANRDRLKAAAKARNEQPILERGIRAATQRRGPDVRVATTEEIAEKARTARMAERKMTDSEISKLSQEFRARQAEARGNAELSEETENEFFRQGDIMTNGEEIEDADILSLEDLPKPKAKAPPTPVERSRAKIKEQAKEMGDKRLSEQLGTRAQEILSTLDAIFEGKEKANGVDRTVYLDYATAVLNNGKGSPKGFLDLATRELPKLNKKLGLPPDFITGFGGSNLREATALGDNVSRAEGNRAAGRAAGLEIGSDQARTRNKMEDSDFDLSDLEPKQEKAENGMSPEMKFSVDQTIASIGQERASQILDLLRKQAILLKSQAKNIFDIRAVMDKFPYKVDENWMPESKVVFAIADLTRKKDRQLEALVNQALDVLHVDRKVIDEILQKPIAAEKRGTARTSADINRRSNRGRIGGSTATGGLTGM